MAEDSLDTLEISPPDPSTPNRVFLEVSQKDGLYPMMPHSMYSLPLWPGITLVLLTKVCSFIYHLKCYIYMIISSFTDFFDKSRVHCVMHIHLFKFYSLLFYCFRQIPTSAVAMSVYKFLEAFAKLEKRLSEGQGASAAARGQLNMHDIRNKLDKFIKALGPSELQVKVFMSVFSTILTNKHNFNQNSTKSIFWSTFIGNSGDAFWINWTKFFHHYRNNSVIICIKLKVTDEYIPSISIQSAQLHNVWTEFKNRAFARGGPGLNSE